MNLMTIFRKTILLIAIGLLIYQLKTGWKKLSNPDLLEVKTNEDLQNVDPPLVAICPTGQFQEETLQNYDYTTFTNMLNGRLLSNSNVLAWGAQKNMSFVKMTNIMIDQELNVSLDTSEYFQERKFHPHLGVCWLMKPSFDGVNVMDLDFTVQLRERDTSDTDNGTEESSKDNGTEKSITENDSKESSTEKDTEKSGTKNDKDEYGTDKGTKESGTDIDINNITDESGTDMGKQESGKDNCTELHETENCKEESGTGNGAEESGKDNATEVYKTDNSTEASVTDNGTDNSTEESVKENSTDNGTEDSVNDNSTDKSTDESSTYISTEESANDQNLNGECKHQNAVQIIFLDGNMNTNNSFSLSAHKGDVISHSKGGVYEYEVALKVVSSFNPKNKSFCKHYLKGEYATCVDDNSQNIFMPVFGCNPPWFSPTNSCTGKIKDIKKLEKLKNLNIENYSLI